MKKSFLIYQEWEEVIDTMTDNQAGKLFKSLLDHARGEKVMPSHAIAQTFILFRQQLDRNLENYKHVSEVNSKNAKSRWKTRLNNATAYNRMPSHTNAYDKDKDKDINTEHPNKKKKLSSSLKAVPVPRNVKHSNEDYWVAAVAASEGKK